MRSFIDPKLSALNVATHLKYLPSGLQVLVMREDRHGNLVDANLESADKGVAYPLVEGKDLLVPIWMRCGGENIYFPEAVVNVTKSRNIVATPVLNGAGTVKEMITEGDLELAISVAIVSTTPDGDYNGNDSLMYDVYPYKGIERLRKVLDTPARIDIVSDFLKLFDLDGGELGIVVKSYSVNQTTHLNRQIVEIQAMSDYDYNLLIEE